ncbi:MAG: hypothetical protein QOF85_798 [Solirubrobacterales bacterium]|jgi:hypothetical protein|nr:hypothetical protein [Solirubrobacterales bacterium]
MPRLLASIGPATAVFEALASSIGAGLVVGGFSAGVRGFLSSRSFDRSEREALKGSYLGGAVGLLTLAFDIVWKHFV